MEVHLLGYLYYYTVYDKVWTVDELADGLGGVVRCAVLRPYLIVDGILRQFDMQLTEIAVDILASEVIDAIGNVAGFLYLSQKVAGTDGMQPTSR